MRSVEEHLERILATASPRSSETVAIPDALGRTSAEPLLARTPIPAFDNSAMDGFAVLAADLATGSPITLRIVADLPAGSGEDPALRPGEAIRIMTGAPIPSDADVVVPVERTTEGFAAGIGDTVTLTPIAGERTHVRRGGAEAGVGELVVEAGVALSPRHLEVLASAGHVAVAVARRPRVAVISTGDELAAPGAPLGRGRIPESNSIVLAALVRETGAEVVHCEHVGDDPAAVLASIDAARRLGVDAVICSGGVSEGAYEPVRQALGGTPDDPRPGSVEFGPVAMRPGRPQGFGVLDGGTLVFAFPGNPVAAAVSFECFARPALLTMQGRTDAHRPRLVLPTTSGWEVKPGRRQFQPAAVDRSDPAAWRVVPTRDPDGRQSALARGAADALIDVPPEIGTVRAGDLVGVMLL